MPHYSDGTEAKVGDLAFGRTHNGSEPVAGYVSHITPQSTTCNMHVVAIRPVVMQETFWGSFLSVSSGYPDSPRSNVSIGSELANCSDFTLLFRKDEPATT